MNIKRFFVITLYAFIMLSFAGCDFEQSPAFSEENNEAENYDVSRFFLKKVEYEMADEYIICYEKSNSETIEVKNVGFNEIPIIIANQRIFYADNYTVIAISFDGAEIEKLEINLNPDENYSFERVDSTDGEWLYCSGKKEVYIYGDPVAQDGVHFVPAHFRVKVDFSEYYEINSDTPIENGEGSNNFEWKNGAVAAIAFFNYLDSDDLNGGFNNYFSVYDAYANEYSIFLDVPITDVKTLTLPGDDVFCIIPRYKNTRIVVKPLEWSTDFIQEEGDTVFDETAEAFIIRCNESDLFSNVQITLIANENEVTFSPFISLRDGRIMSDDTLQELYLEGIYAPILEID